MADDWEIRYQTNDIPWQKGEPSPGLVDFLAQHPDLPRARVAVPGCGTGHDVRAWAAAGFNACGFDLAPSARTGCLGFALHRVDHTENEDHWLAGFKTFRSVEPHPAATVIYPSNVHPVQSMWWGDYSAKPAHSYTYKIVLVYGTPTAPTVEPGGAPNLGVDRFQPRQHQRHVEAGRLPDRGE